MLQYYSSFIFIQF